MNRLRDISTVFVILAASLSASSVLAQEEPEERPIIRVEEDWVAYVSNPEEATGAPQITNVISPATDDATVFAVVELNHGSQTDFFAGGLQLQAWNGETLLDLHNSDQGGVLHAHYDPLRYTVVMELSEGNLVFRLTNGRSRSWGHFTDGEDVSLSLPTQLVDLSGYDRDYSLANTFVNTAAHRVEMIIQREVRYYSAEGLEQTDTLDKTIHRYQSLVQEVSFEDYENDPNYHIEPTEN